MNLIDEIGKALLLGTAKSIRDDLAGLAGGTPKLPEWTAIEQTVAACLTEFVRAAFGGGPGVADTARVREFSRGFSEFAGYADVQEQLLRPFTQEPCDAAPVVAELEKLWNAKSLYSNLPNLPEGYWSRAVPAYCAAAQAAIRANPLLRPIRETNTPLHDHSLDKYKERVRDAHAYLRTEGLTPAERDKFYKLRLEQVFVEPAVREDIPAAELDKSLQERLRRDGLSGLDRTGEPQLQDRLQELGRLFRERPTRRLWDAVTTPENRRMVIVGDPGSGKSTVCRYLAFSLVSPTEGEARLRERLPEFVPFLIELKDYVGFCHEEQKPECRTFVDYLNYLGSVRGFHLRREDTNRLLRAGLSALLVLDGLDEVFDPDERREVMLAIAALDYPGTRVLVTSRIVGYDRTILEQAGFRHYTLQDLDTDRIDEFTSKWYAAAIPDEPEEGELRRKRIRSAVQESESIRALAGNPMLLTIMAIMARHQEIPRERSLIYQRAAEVLVEHWEVNKHFKEQSFQAPYIGTPEKFELLRRTALLMQTRPGPGHGNYATRSELEKLFEDYVVERFQETRGRALELARRMINHFRQRNFILCWYGGDLYGFVHRAFLEYFCASSFATRLKEDPDFGGYDGLSRELVSPHYRDDAWHEVIRLACGLIGDKFGMRLAGDLAGREVGPANRYVPPWSYLLAVQCIAECRNPAAEPGIADLIVGRLSSLLELYSGQLPDSIYAKYSSEISTFMKDVGVAWAAAADRWTSPTLASRWLLPGGTLAAVRGSDTVYALRLAATLCRGDPALAGVLESYAANGMNWRLRAVALEELARVRSDDPHVLALLRRYATEDSESAVRSRALTELASGWHDDPSLLPLLKRRAVEDEYWIARWVALGELAHSWHDDPDVLPLLKRRAVEDPEPYPRETALRELARGWHDDPDVLPLLKHCALDEARTLLRRSCLSELARGWHDDPDVLPLLKRRAVEEPEPNARIEALRELARGWHDDPDVLQLLKRRAVERASWIGRSAALSELARAWRDDPDVLPLLKRHVIEDSEWSIRDSALRDLARGWPEDPDVLPLLKRRATEDSESIVRHTALSVLAHGWHDDPDVLRLLKLRAVEDPEPYPRDTALIELARGWHDDPEVLPLLKRFAADDTSQRRRDTALRELARRWPDDPDVVKLLETMGATDTEREVP